MRNQLSLFQADVARSEIVLQCINKHMIEMRLELMTKGMFTESNVDTSLQSIYSVCKRLKSINAVSIRVLCDLLAFGVADVNETEYDVNWYVSSWFPSCRSCRDCKCRVFASTELWNAHTATHT
jgi:hypothetical protein